MKVFNVLVELVANQLHTIQENLHKQQTEPERILRQKVRKNMNRNNASKMIKDIMKQCNVKQYEVADYLGIRESNFCRDLRYYMTPNKQKEIIVAITKILEIKACYKELSDLKQIIQEWKKEYINEIIVERDILNKEFDELIQQVNEL